MELGADTRAVRLAAGLLFLWALLLGVWKYFRRDTDNQFRDPMPGLHGFMWALIAAEIAGFAVLLAGFVEAQILSGLRLWGPVRAVNPISCALIRAQDRFHP